MRRLLSLLVGWMILLAGCNSTPVARPSPTGSPVNPYKAAFIRQASAICQAAVTRFAAIPTPGTDTKLRAAALDQEVAITQDELNSTENIPVPREDATVVQHFFDTIAQVISLAKSEADSLRSGDLEQATVWDAELQQANTSVSTQARAYGLTACA